MVHKRPVIRLVVCVSLAAGQHDDVIDHAGDNQRDRRALDTEVGGMTLSFVTVRLPSSEAAGNS